MASINIGEDDFGVLFEAAHLAQEQGRPELADALDKLARKANAALTYAASSRSPVTNNVRQQKWTEVPSVFTHTPPDREPP